MQCEYCDCEDSEENKVIYRTNPFNADVYDDQSEHYICEECHASWRDSI